MAAATPLLSVAARRCTRSASTIGRREVMDCHSLTIDGCTAFKKIPKTWFSTSESFVAAGHVWRIRFYPKGECWRQGYMSLYLELDSAACYRSTDPVDFKFTLLDLAGNPVPQYSRAMAAHVFSAESRRMGFNDFIRWKDLERSGCLKDDRFTVRCDITAFQDYWTAAAGGDDSALSPVQVTVPPSNLHEHLGDLLGKKQGADVTVDVAGEAFDAHGWLLAARSPVFEAKLLATTKEKAPSGGGAARRRVVVEGMEPQVFKAMLHFMYTDVLPEMEETQGGAVAMSQDLLAGAHRYKLERLKLMCEEMLCKRIDVHTAASTLAVAEQHGCRALKAACLGFMARPGNLKAVMETKGFEKIKANCPAVMLDLIMKQVAARMAIHQP